MKLNPPRIVRAALYVLTLVGTPVVAYLNAKGIVGATEVTFWSAEVAVVGSIAALNVATTPDTDAFVKALRERDRATAAVGAAVNKGATTGRKRPDAANRED